MSCATGLPTDRRSPTHVTLSKAARVGRSTSWLHAWLISHLIASLLLAACCGKHASAYTPDDPQVQAMVARGIAYLERLDSKAFSTTFEGGPLLVGYAVYKVTGDKEHPLVKNALRMALQRVADIQRGRMPNEKIIYEAAVVVMLLADIDAATYRPQLIQLRDFYRNVQKSHGGYGYLSNPRGDTSQTQYATLALWTLQKNDIDVPTETADSLLRYLKLTQDPQGGWGYTGVVSPNAQTRVKQEAVTKTLSTAGSGATLISADTLGLLGRRIAAEDDPDIPKAFVRVDHLDREKERIKKNNSSSRMEDVEEIMKLATEYHRVIPTDVEGTWHYYFRYSEERYESFLEVMKGKSEKSPAWYNAGVNELKAAQDTQGAWGTTTRDSCSPEICTAFAILYLIRSTQKTIARLNEGVLAGGYGLPSNAGAVKRVGNRIVSEETASVETLLEQLEKNGSDKVELGLLPENMALSKDPAVRKTQVSRLARLLSSQDWKGRRVAARLLGRSEDINQVPELIYALTDADSEVPVLAEESLRLLTRKLNERHVELDSTLEQKREAAAYWKAWYQAMRPDYVFLEK